jgi:integrase
VGRKRKDGDPLGLAGTRLVFKRGRFHYIHRSPRRWEDVGTDVAAAKAQAARFNNPAEAFGTMAYWFGEFLADMKLLVAAKARSQRTLDDYTEYADKAGPLVAAFGARFPETIAPHEVQGYLDFNAKLVPPRLTQSNREKALLSSCISWLIRTGKVPGLVVNPCMRASGVLRNEEKARERYVTHDEMREVWEVAPRSVRLMMALTYRTLQRPDSDIVRWTTAVLQNTGSGRELQFRQNKTKRLHRIAVTGELAEVLPKPPEGNVRQLAAPLVARLDGEAYTYGGLLGMLNEAIHVANERRKARKLAPMESFGFRDLKGKGATDMYYIDKKPIELIQALCGHATKTTTEIYIKQRWQETAQPNQVVF